LGAVSGAVVLGRAVPSPAPSSVLRPAHRFRIHGAYTARTRRARRPEPRAGTLSLQATVNLCPTVNPRPISLRPKIRQLLKRSHQHGRPPRLPPPRQFRHWSEPDIVIDGARGFGPTLNPERQGRIFCREQDRSLGAHGASLAQLVTAGADFLETRFPQKLIDICAEPLASSCSASRPGERAQRVGEGDVSYATRATSAATASKSAYKAGLAFSYRAELPFRYSRAVWPNLYEKAL
jgi:hypothetical protein